MGSDAGTAVSVSCLKRHWRLLHFPFTQQAQQGAGVEFRTEAGAHAAGNWSVVVLTPNKVLRAGFLLFAACAAAAFEFQT